MARADGELVRAVLDAAPTGAALVGPDGAIALWNAAAAELTGWAAEDVVGGPDPSIPPADRVRTEQVVADWLAHPDHGERTIVRRLRPDGSAVHLALEHVQPIVTDEGTSLAVWFTAATDVDALLLQRNRLSRRLVGATRLDEVLPVLTTAVRELLGATSAIVLRRCPPRDHLHGVRGLGVETEVAEQFELDLGGDHGWDAAVDGWMGEGRVVVDGRSVHATFVPMGPEGDGWVLALCDTQPGSISAVVHDLALAVADEAWVALQRVALVADLDGKIEILEATNRLAGSVGLDLQDALAAVTRQSAEALSCERAAVYLADAETNEVSLAHVYASDAAPAQLLADDEGLALAQQVIDTGEEQLFQDVGVCEIAEGPWHADQGSVAVLGLPMHVGPRIVGALVVAHTVAHPRGFTSLCQQVGGAVSQQAALAVEHARLFDVEKRNVERLRELDRMKADWMAGITHDLKAPLTGLLGFVETLRRLTGHVSEEQQREFLEVMSRQADQLVGLVEDLLLSARVDAEEVARRRQLVPIDELVDAAVSTLAPDQRDHLTVENDTIRTPVLGDASHVQRVFQNLLSNAWRHGGQRVTLSIEHDDGMVLVAVEDDGPGVPEEDRARIFERFVHGGGEGSSGLGLYVAKGIVDAHDGTLRVVDRRDGQPGARFEVRFPRGRSQREQDLEQDVPVDRRRATAGVAL